MAPPIECRVDAPLAPREVAALLNHTDWAGGRSEDGVAAMLTAGLTHVSAHRDGAVVGFARAFGDGVYRAVIEDVVVRTDQRGAGVGHRLVGLLLERLAGVEELMLFCGPSREGFYAAHGFERHLAVGMRRLHREA